MTHPVAFAISVALTLMLGVGIVAGRDRLFADTADAGSTSVAPGQVVSRDATSGSDGVAVSSAPRIIEIPLPGAEQRSTVRGTEADEGSSQDRADSSERDWDDEDDEHEEDGDD